MLSLWSQLHSDEIQTATFNTYTEIILEQESTTTMHHNENLLCYSYVKLAHKICKFLVNKNIYKLLKHSNQGPVMTCLPCSTSKKENTWLSPNAVALLSFFPNFLSSMAIPHPKQLTDKNSLSG